MALNVYDRRMEASLGLRDRKKLKTRLDFVQAAVELYDQQGFEATTLDDICARANYSRRTFFRYFNRKEDLVFGELPEQVNALREALEQARDDPDPLSVIRRQLMEATRAFTETSDEQLLAVDLWYREPQLHRRYAELVNEWEDAICDYLVTARAGWPETSARIAATALCGVVRAVLRAHLVSPDETHDALIRGFDLLEHGLRSDDRF